MTYLGEGFTEGRRKLFFMSLNYRIIQSLRMKYSNGRVICKLRYDEKFHYEPCLIETNYRF